MKPLVFSECLAHPPGDFLPEHLLRVAQIAADSIAPNAHPAAREIAFVAGLFHDIGKATTYFQIVRLQQNKKNALTSHAQSGAVLSWWYTEQLDWSLWQRLAVFNAVMRHHGALNCDAWNRFIKNTRSEIKDETGSLQQQLQAIDLSGIQAWLEMLENQLNLPRKLSSLSVEALKESLRKPKGVQLQKTAEEFDLSQAIAALAGFGGLLASDKIDAALSGEHLKRQAIRADAVSVYKTDKFPIAENLPPLVMRRNQIAAEVLHTWLAHPEQRLFTLTAPTGSGKTLAILDAALQMRARLNPAARIIYCLPFTSVIDQNHKVFQNVLSHAGMPLREDILLKHHHLTDKVFCTENAEHQADGAGQLLTESWQSEIVVTTFYQLLHTVLSKQNANLKRAAQLSGSIVLMDEVQAVPLKYWQTLRHLFSSIAETLNTRFVLLTATHPLIFNQAEAIELLPSHVEHFQAMSRVTLQCHHHTPLSLGGFSAELIAQDANQATLVIVNRKRSVSELYQNLREAFPQRPILALSTWFTPWDRRARIRLIQRRLRQGKPCIVITTQLIESGVDVSFPVVHRELAPLDSIIQSAGRCNRHASAQAGEVHLWQLCKEKTDGNLGQALWQRVYDSSLIEATEEVLGHQALYRESDFLELSQRYFKSCERRHTPETLEEDMRTGNFEKIHTDFKLIEEYPQRTVFVIGQYQNGDNRVVDMRLWDAYRDIQEAENLKPFEKEQAFGKIRRQFYERVIQVKGNANDGVEQLLASEGAYNREIGFTNAELSNLIF